MSLVNQPTPSLSNLWLSTEPEVVEQLHRISVDEYHRLGEAGILGRRTELIRGMVLDKMSKSPLHTWLVDLIADWLREKVPTGWVIRTQSPVTLTDSEPEPDVAVVSGSRDDYRDKHPSLAVLAVEVCVSTEKIDREKALLYAESGFLEYWLVLPTQGVVEVHRNPANGKYLSIKRLTRTETLSPEAFPDLQLPLTDLLSHG